jgi:hypothetical protein
MAISLVKFVREKARQRTQDDADFLQRYLYFFEMRVPQEVATLGGYLGYLFPLVIPPKSYTMTEPFTLEATPTQGGGLFIEENGIVQRTIRLRGHTGFKPRSLKLRLGDAYPATLDASKRSYSRELLEYVIDKISGQRHFQYLQDAVFRTYADLKRDPATSADTKLIFHNPKDRESWLVAPREFTLERDASSPHLYNYSIDLLVLDKADVVKADFSEDKGIFDTIKDVLRSVKKGLDLMAGAINDLTAVVAEIKSVVNTIDDLLDAATAIYDAATDFANGVTDLINIPYTFAQSMLAQADAARGAINAFNELGSELRGRDVPDAVDQKIATLMDGVELIASYPKAFERSVDTLIREQRERQEARRSLSDNRKKDAEDFGSPTTFDAYRNLGTQLTSGDVQSAKGEITTGSLVRNYKTAREVPIEDGDTLASLAAKFMGDARLWQYIAIMNGLKPPYIDAQASAPLVGGTGTGSVLTGRATGADESPFSKTLGVGSKILIPTNQTSSLDLPILPVMGVPPNELAEVQFLGTDLKLDAIGSNYGSSREQYDIPIDTEKGSVDGQTISGMNNLGQAIIILMLTDRGADKLYTYLGVHRVVSLNFAPLELEIARFRIMDAISRDPRVSSVRLIRFGQGDAGNPLTADQLKVDLTVGVRGFAQSYPIQVLL